MRNSSQSSVIGTSNELVRHFDAFSDDMTWQSLSAFYTQSLGERQQTKAIVARIFEENLDRFADRVIFYTYEIVNVL
ncbi:hypothetical protein DPMN_099242 [Dreissena polymorpha]|uniref:Uncharacterized protein n=1 Tax=Dreissena polymorpha TaxID=45954 RepID=A0A9D4R807_DREPO|nr:hypothetical protein DPMN_099242 [Dreissena polymorpha]